MQAIAGAALGASAMSERVSGVAPIFRRRLHMGNLRATEVRMLTARQRSWLLNRFLDGKRLMAEANSADDKELQRIERAGAIEQYDAMFGNNYYSLTNAGRRALTHR